MLSDQRDRPLPLCIARSWYPGQQAVICYQSCVTSRLCIALHCIASTHDHQAVQHLLLQVNIFSCKSTSSPESLQDLVISGMSVERCGWCNHYTVMDKFVKIQHGTIMIHTTL